MHENSYYNVEQHCTVSSVTKKRTNKQTNKQTYKQTGPIT